MVGVRLNEAVLASNLYLCMMYASGRRSVEIHVTK